MNKRIPLPFLVVLLASIVAGCNQVSSQPAPTLGPAPTPIPGFTKMDGKGVALWLPDTFAGNNFTGDDREMILQRLKSLGKDFDTLVKAIENNPDMFLLWVFDSKIGDSGNLTNVNVTSEQVLSAITVDTYMDAALKQLSAQFSITSRDSLTIGASKGGRIIIELKQMGMKEALYIVKAGNTMYVVTYATGAEEFDQRLPVFEQSAQTFAVTK
jgi:hypothetical protein